MDADPEQSASGSATPGRSNMNGADTEAAHPARDLSLHLLRMVETRIEAAGIVLQSESRRLVSRVQLHLLAAAAIFIAIWGGIVLLAIALPPHLRVPVLAGVVGAFVLTAVIAIVMANRKIAGSGVGSLDWFLDSLKQDLEVWARSLAHHNAQSNAQPVPPPDHHRSPPSDIAA
jgi:uncharacterized membrane protein YqjE